MANAVWPAGLPQAPLVSQLVESFPDEVIRTRMEVGPDKVRRRLAAAITPVQVELKLTRAQVALFRAFFRDTCASGATPFEWKDHRTGDEPVLYRFVGVPDVRPSAPRQDGSEPWTATFTLEIVPAGVADGGGGGGGGGGDGELPAGGGSDLLSFGDADGSGGESSSDGDGSEAYFMPVIFEADEPAPVFLLDALQVFGSGGDSGDGDAGGLLPAPFGGGGDGGQHGGVPQQGQIVVPQ